MTEHSPELAIFDFAKALTLAGTNKTALKQSLSIFIKNINAELNALNQALEQNDLETIIKIAHKINGSSSYLGAQQIKKTCEQISHACKTESPLTLMQLINKLHQQTSTFLNTIKTRKVLDVLS